MSAAAQEQGWDKPSRRRVPRFLVRVPLDVTVLRSGIPDTLPGRSVNFCERGLAAVLAGELLPGETVGVEVRLPLSADPLRTRALVRHQDKVQCGMEFVALSAEQQAAIRHWTEESKAEPELRSSPVSEVQHQDRGIPDASIPDATDGRNRKPRGRLWTLFLILAAIVLAIVWWRWNRAWEELETGGLNPGQASADQPRLQVAAEVMDKLLVRKVEPDYPAAARQARLHGVIVLDIVVGRDGSVVGMRPMNGPEVLARSAMDALRWWKFEPYRVNGEPATVETTVALEFKP
jgi:TonB family protein